MPDHFPPTIVDSFVEVIGSKGHLHFDRKRESIELSTEAKFYYPKTFLMQEVFGKLRGAFVECLNDFISAIVEDTPPKDNCVRRPPGDRGAGRRVALAGPGRKLQSPVRTALGRRPCHVVRRSA